MSRFSSFKSLARASKSTSITYRSFATRQINLGNLQGDATLVSNDDVLHVSPQQQHQASFASGEDTYFEPTIVSHEDVVTPAPVNRGKPIEEI